MDELLSGVISQQYTSNNSGEAEQGEFGDDGDELPSEIETKNKCPKCGYEYN